MNDQSVIRLPASAHMRPEQAIASAAQEDLSDVLIIGFSEGHLFVRSSFMTRAEALFLLEKGKEWVMDGGR